MFFRMANFVDELANLIIGDGPVVIDEDGNETNIAIFGIRSVMIISL